ncbi:class I SAM-dependent methyltransferase [Kineosporia sp. R_H_3]|uniref:class I SAM-dependent DNA methyltransferase n=1 Tax=Kineosporia sp. R_H_3 TaxID=1961848 RepID=UPI000B4B6E02|nr:class I SAM-dependent methyltransferase [Kineosporia sp. R_H_3]
MIYQHPLAYLLGLQGRALLRAFAGEYDREFTQARLAEVRALLDSADVLGEGGSLAAVSVSDGYEAWAPRYDEPGNAMVDREGPLVRALLDRILAGDERRTVLDAACGTRRHAAHVAARGHRVIGTDCSAAMLALARSKLPGAELHQADLAAVPLLDASVDVVVCGLALAHVRDLGPVFMEFARVLRPGGHLVVSDSRGYMHGGGGYPIVVRAPGGGLGYIPSWSHPTSAYLKAALPVGFQVRQCDEPPCPGPLVDEAGTPPGDPAPVAPFTAQDGHPDIWSLHSWAAAATNAAYDGKPHFIVWHFQLPL